jgi:hypothetical protein
MVARWFIFIPINPNLGIFWRVLEWKMLVYFITIWNSLRPLGVFDGHLVQFVVIWYIFHVLVCFDQDKSGSPGTVIKAPLHTTHL